MPGSGDPGGMLALLQTIATATTTVRDVIDKAPEPIHEERQALKDLRKALASLNSDIMVYKVLMNVMENDYTDPDGRSPHMGLWSTSYTHIASPLPYHSHNGKTAMSDLEGALQATRLLLLADNPASIRHEATMNFFWDKRPGRALIIVLNVLRVKFRPGQLIDDIKDAIDELYVCQQNNERTFKLVWNLYAVAQQATGRSSSVGKTEFLPDHIGQGLGFALHAFQVQPFAVSSEGDSQVNLPIFTTLNHNHETATRYEQLARRIGKAWVDDRICRYNAPIRDLGALQTSLFELLWSGTVEQLKRYRASSADDPERPEFEKAVGEPDKALREAIVRSRRQRFTIAFCGAVNAGKSLFLNSLMGRAILPSDELPSTAWPCRLRHIEGQTVPELLFQAEPFLAALKEIQAHQYGRKMQTYQPPPHNMFEALLSHTPSEPSEGEVLLRRIYSQWIDLHAATRDNLLRFEDPGFKLPHGAVGEQNVKTLLGQLNDIVWLCARFDLKLDISERMDCIYELIDLPGVRQDIRGRNTESFIPFVASDPNAIVPVISFKSLRRSDWKCLPDLVASGFNGRGSMVVCTHLDQVSQENIDKQVKTVTKIFWPRDVLNTNRCSPLMGLSATDLLDKSNVAKPPFDAIWNKHSVGHHCAAKVLGVGDPKATYDRFDTQTWRDKLKEELRASSPSGAIQSLTKEMLESAQINALLSESGTIIKQLREMSNVQKRKLLEARRTKEDHDTSKESHKQRREQICAVLDSWNSEEHTQIHENRQLLEKASIMISQKAHGFIDQAIKKALQDLRLRESWLEDGDLGHGPRGATAGEKGLLIVKTVAHAEEFLRLSQHSLLNTLKLEYAAIIQTLAETARNKRWDAIKHLDSQLQPKLRAGIVGDLEFQSIDIRKVTLQQISGVVGSRPWQPFTRQYKLRMDVLYAQYDEEIIDPWIKSVKKEGEKCLVRNIKLSSNVMKASINSALERAESRYKQEIEGKNKPLLQKTVRQLIAMYGHLVAAEEALREMFIRIDGSRGHR